MGKRISMDPELLAEHAKVLEEHGKRIGEFTAGLRSMMREHDPADNDPVGLEIGARYHESCLVLLDGGDAAGELVTSLGRLTAGVARGGALAEAALVRDIEDDDAGYNPVVGSKEWWNPDAKPNTGTGVHSAGPV